MSIAIIAAASIAGIQQAPASSSVSPATGWAASTTNDEQRLAAAGNIGSLLYSFDRAAWVSTDALMATVPKDQLAGVGGYVVEAADAHTLRVTYYRGSADAAQSFFIADVRAGQVVRKELLATPIALTPLQARLAQARDVAVARARERSYKPCTPLPFNTVVVPSRSGGGPVAVYLLTAQQDNATYPMGGNYRVIVAADGKVLASRPYSVSCLNMPIPKLPAGATPVGIVVSHILDPLPTELHVFASYNLRMPVFVTTTDKRVWKVQGSSITLASGR